jgi:hypothetical protein
MNTASLSSCVILPLMLMPGQSSEHVGKHDIKAIVSGCGANAATQSINFVVAEQNVRTHHK